MIEIRISAENVSSLVDDLRRVMFCFENTARYTAGGDVIEAVATETPAAEAPKRGRKPKAPSEPVDATKQTEMFDDPLPADLQPKAELTYERCRDVLRLALKNAEARYKAAAGDDAAKLKNVMVDAMAYLKPLLAKFGVTRASELKPEQFAAFIDAATPYVQGTA